MLVNFTKMHGLGNDFVVIDLITQSVRLHPTHIQRIADRNMGIGCDQVLLIEPPMRSDADFFFRIFNADGQEVEQCGNGARCVARFFYDAGFTNQTSLQVDCLAGPLELQIEEEGAVTVNLGVPRFHPKDIPFSAEKEADTYPITVDHTDLTISVVSLGNPHAILQVPEINSSHIQTIAPKLCKHERFPKGANISFMQIIDSKNIQLHVYERGVGETLACGSAAAASVVAGIQLGLLEKAVDVAFSKGKLHITWAGNQSPVFLKGPTTSVFVGRFRL